MDITNLPLNKTVKFSDDEYTSLMLTRVEEDKVVAQYVSKSNGDEVACMHIWNNGGSEIVTFDQSYWSYIINGNPATKQDISELAGRKFKSVNIDIAKREMIIAL